MKNLAIALCSLLLVSCSYYSPIYWGWGEWVGADVAGVETAPSATIDWFKLPGVITAIDGKIVGNGYKQAKLPAGKHIIEYAYYTAGFGAHPQGVVELEMEPGHSYEFEIKLCFWCMPRRFAVWVDDRTMNKVVWGERPDWPSWWL